MSLRADLFFIICVSMASSSCLSKSTSQGIAVSLAHDAEVLEPDGQRRNIKMGPNLKLGDAPLYISAAGREPLLLVPVKDTAASIRVDLRKTPAAVDSGTLKEQLEFQRGIEIKKLSESYSKLLPRFFETQILISNGKQEEALTNLSIMRAEFPSIPYLGFFVADVLHSLGRNVEALAAVKEASRDFPDDKRGASLRLLIEKSLSRGVPSPQPGEKQ